MSFFTNDAYASFRQAPPVGAVGAAKLDSTQRRLDNSSFASNASTASMLSELDPLSPVNLQRAADPWYGNALPTASSSTPSRERDHGVPKVFIEEADADEDWGEFVNCSPIRDAPPPPVYDARDTRARKAKGRAQHVRGDNDEMASAGWSRFPMGGGEDYEPTSLFDDDDDDLNDGSFLPYQMTQAPPQQQPQEISLVKSLLSRFASFGSASSNGSPSSRRGSFGSTGASPSPSPASGLPRRNYESYDVTFEKGPIGLELETDWYGRQAVVKGFKKINNADGPAKSCGVIRVGDVLTAINGESCLELSFTETLAKLREVSGVRHRLHFKSLEAAGDLSVYNQASDIIEAKKFIHQHKEKFYRAPAPLPDRQLILGCVERLHGDKVTTFNFHREDTGAFVLACSCVNERTGVFLFHTLQDAHLREWKDLPMNEDSAVFLGRLEPNFLGTEFTLLDHQQKRRNELGFIEYTTNVLGRVPNFLKVAFPKTPHLQGDGDEDDDEEEIELPSRPRAVTHTGSTSGMGSNNAVFNTSMMDRNGTISERYKRVKQQRSLSLVEKLRSFSLDDIDVDMRLGGKAISSSLAAAWYDDDDHSGRARAMRMQQLRTRGAVQRPDTLTPYGAVEQEDFDCDLVTFETRKPSWNEELGAWTLNFQGRVKLASKKNFQVVAEQGNDAMEAEFGDSTTYLRFGKVTKSRFALDYQAPLSPLLALAIACSSFAHKIAVT